MAWCAWILAAFSLAAAYIDLRWRRVPNVLTGAVALVGLAGWAAAGRWDGFLFSTTGLLTGLALLLVPWLLGWVGGGDVKFLAAVGALGGAPFVLRAALVGAVLGGLMALVVLIRRMPWRGLVAWAIGLVLARVGGMPVRPTLGEAGQATLPYAVALAGGVIGAFVLQHWGWGW